MFERLPAFLGRALDGVRAGPDKLLLNEEAASVPETIRVESPAFDDGGSLPVRFTADGEGVSPPLAWSGLPSGTRQVLVVVEDPDVPAPEPLIHLIAVFDAETGSVAEGQIGDASGALRVGRNSLGRPGWLPTDPPPGHGPHHTRSRSSLWTVSWSGMLDPGRARWRRRSRTRSSPRASSWACTGANTRSDRRTADPVGPRLTLAVRNRRRSSKFRK